jgi:hypothetical protein
VPPCRRGLFLSASAHRVRSDIGGAHTSRCVGPLLYSSTVGGPARHRVMHMHLWPHLYIGMDTRHPLVQPISPHRDLWAAGLRPKRLPSPACTGTGTGMGTGVGAVGMGTGAWSWTTTWAGDERAPFKIHFAIAEGTTESGGGWAATSRTPFPLQRRTLLPPGQHIGD